MDETDRRYLSLHEHLLYLLKYNISDTSAVETLPFLCVSIYHISVVESGASWEIPAISTLSFVSYSQALLTLLALLESDTLFTLSVLNCITVIVMHYCLDYTIK